MAEESKRLMIVEDERPLIEAIEAKLKIEGFQTVTARSVEGAIGLLKDGVRIDAIWLDHYLLGKENGLDFVSKLKEHDKWKTIPIFVVSNTASHDKVTHYLHLGVNKYYIKAEHRLEDIIKDIEAALK